MSIFQNLIWTEGRTILISAIGITCLMYVVYRPLALVGLLFIVFSFYFFRNPERVCPEALENKLVLICPADGKVVDIQSSDSAFDGYDQKVSIFLSPFDVHVNWAPMAGTIKEQLYTPGEFIAAYVPKSSLLNERNDIVLVDDHARTIVVRQIAGMLARRVVCWVGKGDSVFAGKKYGMIKFGSRVDILLPKTVALEVSIDQQVLGGQTVLGRWTC